MLYLVLMFPCGHFQGDWSGKEIQSSFCFCNAKDELIRVKNTCKNKRAIVEGERSRFSADISLKNLRLDFYYPFFIIHLRKVIYLILCMKKNYALLIGWKRVHSHVTRVQITNRARALSKFRLSRLSAMFFHVHY